MSSEEAKSWAEREAWMPPVTELARPFLDDLTRCTLGVNDIVANLESDVQYYREIAETRGEQIAQHRALITTILKERGELREKVVENKQILLWATTSTLGVETELEWRPAAEEKLRAENEKQELDLEAAKGTNAELQ